MDIYIYIYIWLVVSTPLKNMKVSWDDEIPNLWKVIKTMFQTTNQIYIYIYIWGVPKIGVPLISSKSTTIFLKPCCPCDSHAPSGKRSRTWCWSGSRIRWVEKRLVKHGKNEWKSGFNVDLRWEIWWKSGLNVELRWEIWWKSGFNVDLRWFKNHETQQKAWETPWFNMLAFSNEAWKIHPDGFSPTLVVVSYLGLVYRNRVPTIFEASKPPTIFFLNSR